MYIPKWLTQFSLYAMVGGLAFVVDFAALHFLVDALGMHYLAAASISFILGLVINYGLCLYFVFNERTLSSPASEFFIFAFVGCGGLIINDVLMLLGTGLLHWPYTYSKISAAFFVLMFNFIMRRQLLFSPDSSIGIRLSLAIARLDGSKRGR